MNKIKKLALVQRILKQAVKISSNSIIDVSVEYTSHVELLTVRVYLKGWNRNDEADYRQEVWFRIYNEEDCIKKLEEILRYLKGVKTK